MKDKKDVVFDCPFCGLTPVGPIAADSDWWIECEHCEIVMDNESKRELLRKWNSRVKRTG